MAMEETKLSKSDNLKKLIQSLCDYVFPEAISKISILDIDDPKKATAKGGIEIIKANIPSSIPIGVDLPFGHTSKNEPFINGFNYQLEVNDSGARLEPLPLAFKNE